MHGNWKAPRNQKLHQDMAGRKGGPHEDKTGGRGTKRARMREIEDEEIESQLDDWNGYDEEDRP